MDFPAYPFDNDHLDYKLMWYSHHHKCLEDYFKLAVTQYNEWDKTYSIYPMNNALHFIKHISNYVKRLEMYFHENSNEFLKLFPKDNEFYGIRDINLAIRDIMKQTRRMYYNIRRNPLHDVSELPRRFHTSQIWE
jgi:hypothetical protein